MIDKEKLLALQGELSWLTTFVKYHRLIIGVFLATSIVTILVTEFLIKPEYKSTALVYAVPSYGPESVIPPQHFGTDDDNEAFIQILESIEVEKVIEKKFNLMEHYKIDVRSKKRDQDLIKKYQKNVEVKKTNHGSIEVSVRDIKPETAAEMANEIVKEGGKLLEQIKKGNVEIVLKDREREFFNKKNEIDSLETELSKVSKLMDPKNPYDLNNIKFIRLKKEFLDEIGKLSDKKSKYELTLNHFTARVPSYYLVDSAVPTYQKVYPKIIIVLAVVLSPVMLLLFLLLSFLEKIQKED